MAINLPQKPRAGMHAIHELTKSINGVIDYLSTFLFSGDGFIKVNRSMFRADFSLDLEKLKKKLELENIHTEYDGFFKAELISQNFTPEEEAELDESGYYHGVLQITSGAPSSLNGYSYMYLNGYQLRFYSVSDFSPVKRGFLCIYVRIDPETDRGIDYGYVIESTFPENRDTSILKYPVAWIYRTGDEWKVFQIVRYEIPSLYLFDYPGSFLCSVFYRDENEERTFYLLVSKGFPDQNEYYCGTYANADGSNLQSVSRQTVEIPSAGTYEARVYRDGQIRLRNLNAAIPDFNQPSVEDYVTLGRIEIPAEAYEIPPETDGLIFPDYRVTQIWKGDNIYKNNSIWTGSFRLEARLSEDETKVLARISDAYGLTSGRVKIHYNRDNQNDYLTVNYPAGSVEVPLSGTSAWMLFHFEYDANQQIPELNVTGETVIAPEIRYNATNISYGNYIKPSYSSALIGRIRARNQFS
ncbi:MAG: hypothetical protein J5858_07300, partial [Lentisphaeria bacterium]|nr:hypothetical protein [Lentisphaeria bacterium]